VTHKYFLFTLIKYLFHLTLYTPNMNIDAIIFLLLLVVFTYM